MDECSAIYLFVNENYLFPGNPSRNRGKWLSPGIWSPNWHPASQTWSMLRHTHILRSAFIQSTIYPFLIRCMIFRILRRQWVWWPTIFCHAIYGEWECSELRSMSPWLCETTDSMGLLLYNLWTRVWWINADAPHFTGSCVPPFAKHHSWQSQTRKFYSLSTHCYTIWCQCRRSTSSLTTAGRRYYVTLVSPASKLRLRAILWRGPINIDLRVATIGWRLSYFLGDRYGCHVMFMHLEWLYTR